MRPRRCPARPYRAAQSERIGEQIDGVNHARGGRPKDLLPVDRVAKLIRDPDDEGIQHHGEIGVLQITTGN
jgi:hypothetical protein